MWYVSGSERAPGDEVTALVVPDETSSLLGLGGAAAACDLDRDGAAELVATLGRTGSSQPPAGVLVVRGPALARIRWERFPMPLGR